MPVVLSRRSLLLCALVAVVAGHGAAAQQRTVADVMQSATLDGIVRDQNAAAIRGARVTLVGTARVAYSDDDGHYRFPTIVPGRYTLRVARIGYAPGIADSIVITAGEHVERDVQLMTVIVPLSQVTITPGSYTLLDPSSASRLTLSREVLATTPQLGEDVFRALSRLPGLSGSDFSAKIRIRNGGADEQLVTLDGLELIEPYHLKDFDGALSMLDGESIGRVSVTTGGFTAASGNRLAGLLQLESATPSATRSRAAVGVSLSNLRARTEGTFASARGSWLVSGRRGYLDLLFKLLRETNPPDPSYSDVFGKVQYQWGHGHIATIEGLVAGDRLSLEDGGFIRSNYGNRYVWGTLRTPITGRAFVTTMASLSNLSWKRDGVDEQRVLNQTYERVRIADRRTLNVSSLKQDVTVDISDGVSHFAGLEMRGEVAAYAYSRVEKERAVVSRAVVVLDSTNINATLHPQGTRASGYVSLRLRPTSPVTTEFGLRADRHTWTDQTTLAPRANIAWNLGAHTTLRGAWGHYYQAHALQDLSVVDGDTAFVHAERAEHRVLGVEFDIGHGWTTRIEGFERLTTSPRAKYVNVEGTLDVFPESAPDRVRFAPTSARVQGAELLARYDDGGRIRGGAAIVRSRATAVVSGRETPRPYDEPLALTVDFAYRTAKGWTIAGAWTSHSGWPSVAPTFVIDTLGVGRYAVRRLDTSPFATGRFASYQRLDFRASRTFQTAHGRLNVWADVFNALNRANQRGNRYSYSFTAPSSLRVTANREDFLGILPSLGLGWEF